MLITQEANSLQNVDLHGNAKNTLVQRVSVKKYTNDNRKSLTARVKLEDLPIINQRLKLYGFNSINELVHDFIKGKFPQITEDRQIENLINNTQSNGLKSFLEGGFSFHSKGQIYKISATLKDALEHRLKREGYVEGLDEKNRSLYSITQREGIIFYD